MDTTILNAVTTAESTNSLQGEQVQVNAGATTMVAGENNNNNNSNNVEIMENSVVAMDSKVISNEVKTIEDLRKEMAKEQGILSNMSKKGVASAVLQVQQQIVDELKNKLESAPEVKAAETEVKADLVTFEIVDYEAGTKENVQMKIGFVDNNRSIDTKKVAVFIALIANMKYEKAYPIIVIKAKLLISLGYTIKDVTGRAISEEEAEEYFVILDGQHRTKAFAQLIAAGQDLVIPNVHVRELENIGEYLTEINQVGNWTKNDKVTVAALINKQDELLQAIATRLKEGFNYSTIAQIFTGKKLTDTILNHALKGKNYTLPKEAKIDINKGNKFITLCQAAGMATSLITKRYFIEGFTSHCASVGEENAFKALENLPKLTNKDARLKEVKEGIQFIELLAEVSK